MAKQERGNKYEPYMIIWRDSNMVHDQEAINIDLEVCLIVSVGFLVDEKGSKYTLIRDIVNDSEGRAKISIPKENVVEIRKLK